LSAGRAERAELLVEAPFLVGGVFGNVYAQGHEQVAAPGAVGVGQAVAGDPEHITGLAAWGDREGHVAVEGGDEPACAQDGIGDAEALDAP
jgi:hypothetical protein